MSDIERLRWLYDEFAEGNWSAAREVMHPQVEWVMAPSLRGLDEKGVYHGLDECDRAMRNWLSAWEWYRSKATEFIDAGDTIVVVCQERARLKGGSNAEIHRDVAAVWTMRDGKAIRFEYYDDRAEAFAAAGLSP
jgi:ketosteroid isomerase-like protein